MLFRSVKRSSGFVNVAPVIAHGVWDFIENDTDPPVSQNFSIPDDFVDLFLTMMSQIPRSRVNGTVWHLCGLDRLYDLLQFIFKDKILLIAITTISFCRYPRPYGLCQLIATSCVKHVEKARF